MTMANTKPEEENEKPKPVENILDIQVKHPLQNIWTFWYIGNDRKVNWQENIKEIVTFSTVEDFWSIHNHIKPPSELKIGYDYCLFKKGIRPEWEDPANKQGGRWLVNLEKRHHMRDNDCDTFWLEVLLCLIGEAFEDDSDQVNGCVINVRQKMDKIGLWTANGDKANRTALINVGTKLKERLQLREKIVFQLHKDAIVKGSSNIKTTYDV